VSADKGLNLRVSPAPPLTIATAALRPAYLGSNYTATLDATGGIPPYTWTFVSGALPDGFSLSGSTITGLPKAVGASNLTLEVSDSVGTKSQRAFVLNVVAAPPTEGLKLLYRTNFTEAASNQIGPQFKLTNAGSDTIPLAELTVKYSFTLESPQPLNFWCDYATLGCDSIQGRFIDEGNGRYSLEVSFTGTARLAPGSDSGEIQLRFAKADWSNFDQSNDYSFDPAKRSYAEWDHTTVYRNGLLIWGVEPPTGK
jgi:hypothetical protein